ncbi:MAG TPA: glutamate synthase large subunit [Kofleriaceae bacterium]|nr:glutamate synthase large subunit [Kofleriaceae bacterium]
MLQRSWTGLVDPTIGRDACGVGFVADIKGNRSREIIDDGLEILRRLSHRGACGADPETGDGAGILIQLPDRWFRAEAARLGFDLAPNRRFAIGQVFLPPGAEARHACEAILEQAIAAEGQRVLGWRDVPIEAAHVGPTALAVMPVFRQIYVRMRRIPPSAWERTLYVIRKLAENRIRDSGVDPAGYFHVASLSTETIVYKGLLLPRQLPQFYTDLRAPELASAIAVVHSRFSTNTVPTWDLAQPFRYIAHNAEINTLRGNSNWMQARKSQLKSAKFSGGLERLFPIIVPGKSDSAQFDNLVELLTLGGRTLPHAMMMMIPEAWDDAKDSARDHASEPRPGRAQDALARDPWGERSPVGALHGAVGATGTAANPLGAIDEDRRSFYRYASSLVEPWDGPAAIVFSDGQLVGATLDRNGLRPARWMVTTDDRVILASETGVIDVPPERVRAKGRLQPGMMFVVDTAEGRIVDDAELKREVAGRFPYRKWLDKNVFELHELEGGPPPPRITGDELMRLARAHGYTDECINLLIEAMARDGKEPVGSMGTDTPLAVLSDHAPNLFAYFHQLFAQVTNPPIDPIRESLVMSLETTMGPDGNTFDETPEQCHQLRLRGPVIGTRDLARIRAVREGVFDPVTLSLVWPVADGPDGLAAAVDRLCRAAAAAIDDGHNVLILSDRGVDARHVAIPSLLALSAVQQYLVAAGIRMQAGLVVETAEAREVHDIALLIGYGAAAVNPYLALDLVRDLVARERLPGSVDEAVARYVHAVEDGLRKVMSKMGISTVSSYRGAQIFEAVGLDRDLVDRHFTGTPSRLGGIGLRELGAEALARHARGFSAPGPGEDDSDALPTGGQYQWRRRGELHKWNPATIAALQAAVRLGDRARFTEFERLCDDEDDALVTLRGMLEVVPPESGLVSPVPLEEVEPASEIVKRFVTGAMSFGSISAEAHETLAIAMNRLGARSNSGEGGEEPHRFEPDEHGDLRRSAIKQIASGRFGVTTHYLVHAEDLQIKIAQGAKPGEGGQLPGNKVDERIARVRCSTPGVTLISPPPHHDIYSIEDLAQLIYDLTCVNPAARVSVKLVSEYGVGTIAAGVAKCRAGCVVIAGYEGGTGAAPLSSLKHAGLPWELGLAETQQVLVANRLRDRIRVQVDGGLRTSRDVIVAALLGAEEFGMATASLIATGCVMLRKCHLNTCSVGIATQDPALREHYTGRPEDVIAYFTFVAERVRERLAALGARSLDELVGRVELLRPRAVHHPKAQKLDLSAILAVPAEGPRRFARAVPWSTSDHVDHDLIRRSGSALAGGRPVELAMPIDNARRAVGTLLSGEIARRCGARGLPDGSIKVRFSGSAGQSFGAFLAPGVTLELCGDANDYIGKGMSGGRIVVYPPASARFSPEHNVIVGNVALYGATAGDLFACGLAGERFAVRNSGARAVVEGVGDHGCEYMTGGVVVVLGAVGRNFAAGMSGGTAYVFDQSQSLRSRTNLEMVELESVVEESDLWLLNSLIEDHVRFTSSPLGRRVLDNWQHLVARFVKVMPVDYKRVLQARRAASRPRPGQLSVIGGGR